MKRFLIIFIVLFAIAGLGYWSYLQSGMLVEATPTRKGTIRAYIEERAKTRVPEVYEITMPLTGRIKPISLKEGDVVEEGQQVAQMDNADLETDLKGSLAQVEQFVEMIKSIGLTVEAAQEQINASLAKFEYEQGEYERVSELAEKNAISQSDLGAAELAQFESRVEHRTDVLTWRSIQAIQAAVQIAKTNSEEEKLKDQRDLNRAEIKTPVSGTVLKRHVSNEKVLQAGEILLELGQMDQLEIEAEVLTQQAVEISIGDLVEIEGPTVGDATITGKVSKIYPQGFTKVSSLGVEEQRVLVIIDFDKPIAEIQKELNKKLGIDYRVRVKIITDESRETLIVPRTCLFRDVDDHWSLFVIRNDKAIKTNVVTGLMNDFEVEIKEGVKEGDQVILAPDAELNDQTRVKLEE
ncbi:MAG: efflux RND transporter periplasmic adaptor subunit [Planctomycetaceae bacterium]|nr:efflux RND transporter periplasmic adaptor subunit [Planctomycetaceae bacterium]